VSSNKNQHTNISFTSETCVNQGAREIQAKSRRAKSPGR